MSDLGEILRRERLRQGLDLQKLSESTKISTRMLQAMETGDLAKLPGGVFTRSFLRQYAAILGIERAVVEAELSQLQTDPAPAVMPPIPVRQQFDLPSSDSNSLTAAAVWFVLAIVGCGGVYYFVRSSPKPGAAPPAAVSSANRGSNPPVSPRTEPPPRESSSAAPAPSDLPPSSNGNTLQVVLNASERVWVSVSVDGKRVFSGTLEPHERKEINAEEKVKVVAGNAGGIGISLNGKDIDSIGPRGQVRTVELTRAGAQLVSRTPSPLL